MKMGSRLLRRVMGMYKDDAVTSNSKVLAEELSQRLFDADGETRMTLKEASGLGVSWPTRSALRLCAVVLICLLYTSPSPRD